jgi:hypothetical protein
VFFGRFVASVLTAVTLVATRICMRRLEQRAAVAFPDDLAASQQYPLETALKGRS